MRFALCDRCRGAGQHTNPAVDGNGLSREDFDELGDDFREDYLAGVYDIPCERCQGLRVLPACAVCERPVEALHGENLSHCWTHLTPTERADKDDEAALAAEYAMERRMGA